MNLLTSAMLVCATLLGIGNALWLCRHLLRAAKTSAAAPEQAQFPNEPSPEDADIVGEHLAANLLCLENRMKATHMLHADEIRKDELDLLEAQLVLVARMRVRVESELGRKHGSARRQRWAEESRHGNADHC